MTTRPAEPLATTGSPPTAIATLRIAPTGSLTKIPRDYVVTLELPAAALGASPGLSSLTRSALNGLSSDPDAHDRTTVRAVSRNGKVGKDGTVPTILVAYEAELFCAGMPSNGAIERVRAKLAEAGYRLTAQERRVCNEPGCRADANVDWGAPNQRPQGWYDEQICGRHNYRSCAGCGSVYRLHSEAASGPAPSLHCKVCGAVMIEWGSSKQWDAELLEDRARSTPT